MKVQVVTQQHAAERWQMTELRERERDWWWVLHDDSPANSISEGSSIISSAL